MDELREVKLKVRVSCVSWSSISAENWLIPSATAGAHPLNGSSSSVILNSM
jgi:hypothetical protein